MSQARSVVVFCGGSPRVSPHYILEAERLGGLLADHKIKLVYGAGGTGMMGALAQGAIKSGGFIIGATIRSLYELEKPDMLESKINQFEVWERMAERKISMTRQADGVCVLPGGFGTMDEFFELLTLRQLGIAEFPIIVVNINGFYDILKQFLQKMLDENFIKPAQLDLVTFVESVDDVIPEIEKQLKVGQK
ncbi:MAG: TIGR00730 family Rossman fold protein [Lactobacillales bacterium]|jgi:uncharacterized protein (TIGR00730 family)|nr:TIGR00730 family Rossman fold protein [Lactobacillales bacterium]